MKLVQYSCLSLYLGTFFSSFPGPQDHWIGFISVEAKEAFYESFRGQGSDTVTVSSCHAERIIILGHPFYGVWDIGDHGCNYFKSQILGRSRTLPLPVCDEEKR
ncbi:hypothetical protein VNO77_05813 [Canavalia gladiata]|uniref:Uncharacterized protein n=1 Tax=Canavalia gladiata TaxID=3824 RepID=A0AAN9REI6_CANGL